MKLTKNRCYCNIPFDKCISILLILLFSMPFANAGDWATYRGNNARSGATAETLSSDLYLQWTYEPMHKPVPAWPVPAEEMPRNHSDNAYHTCIAGGRVYFGSSVTNEFVCLDVESGSRRWSFYAEGPIRYAGTIYEGKVYFGSDDGYVYCLDADNGKQIWKYRAGVSGEKVIGNGRMISLWPVRTSVLVDKGEVYFAAGVFPYEGIYICALNADNGEVVWKNDTLGDRSHELQFGGISPAGYLLASEKMLYIPSGRSLPAAFDRKTGKEHFVASPVGKQGGTWALLDQDKLIAGVDNSGKPRKVSLDAATGKYRGDAFGWFPGVDMAVTKDYAYVLTQKGINSINRSHYSNSVSKVSGYENQRKALGKQLKALQDKIKKSNGENRTELAKQIEDVSGKIAELSNKERAIKNTSDKWFFAQEGLRSMALAGNVIVAGGDGKVVAVNAGSGEHLWTKSVKGGAAGLAVSDGNLLVSSDKGNIYCFGKTKVANPKTIKEGSLQSRYSADNKTATYEAAAAKIAESLTSKKGYCLVLDCGEGRLAHEIAKRTEMQIVGIEKDAKKLAAARERLSRAGLLGKRVVVEAWDVDDLPGYFANLIVSDGLLESGKTAAKDEQINRVLRPYGGIAMLGKKKFGSKKIDWERTVRGKLEGAGEWTHQYANAQNTASSGDKLVSGKLGMQWFGEPGPDGMVERHAKAASPLAKDGRLFVQGEELILACDAFNGTLLWKREIPGAFRVRVDVDSSNTALTEEGLYIAAYDKCYVLDPATGKDLRVFDLPSAAGNPKRRWGYISVVGDVLYGSAATPLKQDYAAKYKEEYPEGDEEAKWAHQRAGTKWRSVTDLPSWENYIPSKGAKTNKTMVSDMFFAMNARTGDVLWKYDGKEMANISMTVADGLAFLTDAAVESEEREKSFTERENWSLTNAMKSRRNLR